MDLYDRFNYIDLVNEYREKNKLLHDAEHNILINRNRKEYV